MHSVIITPATVADLDELQQISRRTFVESFSEENTEENMRKYLAENFSIERLSAEMADPGSQFHLAVMDGQVIGYLKINTGKAQTDKGLDGLEIERIYVLREFQGKRIGQLLFDTAIRIARQRELPIVWLGVWEKNVRAIGFYRKLGFEEFGEHVFHLGSDAQRDVLMKLRI